MKKYKLIFLFLFILLVEPAQPSPSLQKLRLVLDWFINPNHATLFVAEEQGFFKEQGLEVSLLSPADSSEAPKLVAALQAELALVYEPEFIDQIEQGLPLIAIGTLIDKPLNCLLVRQDGPIQRLADLKNKKIGTSGGGIKVLMLKTMLHKQGLSLQEVELIQVHHNLMQALLAKKVDAITGAMRNIEAEQLSVLGHKPLLFFPEKNGVPPYSELIFVVNKNMLQQNKLSSLRGFLLALKKAAAYLNKHPEASWQAFVKKYPALNNESNHRAWLASLPYFTKHPERFSAEEWRAFIAFMRQNGLIKSKQHLSNYINEMTT